MVFVEPIFHARPNVFFPFNGKRKTHSLAIVISQRRTSAGTERYRIYSTGTGNNGVLSAGNNVDIVRAVSDFRLCAKTGYLG